MTKQTDTKRRSDFGLIHTTKRDLAALLWIGEQYAISADLLRILGGRLSPSADEQIDKLTSSTVRTMYSRWYNAGWIEKQKIMADGPVWVWLSRQGKQEIDSPFPYRKPKISQLKHIYAVNMVRLWAEGRAMKAGQDLQWVSDRQVNAERKKRGKHHIVDGEVIYQGATIAIEVELTQKTKKSLESIVFELSQDYRMVWYFVSKEAEKGVEQAISELPQSRQKYFQIHKLSEVQSQLRKG